MRTAIENQTECAYENVNTNIRRLKKTMGLHKKIKNGSSGGTMLSSFELVRLSE